MKVSVWLAVSMAVLGFVVGGSFANAIVWKQLTGPLNECERVHNVYQCKLVPTPVAQPAWVQNGETK